jgi:hypothetical protein
VFTTWFRLYLRGRTIGPEGLVRVIVLGFIAASTVVGGLILWLRGRGLKFTTVSASSLPDGMLGVAMFTFPVTAVEGAERDVAAHVE